MNKLIFGGSLSLMFFIGFQKFVAPSSPYTQVVDSLFRYVDKAPVKTRILYDRVLPFARLDQVDKTRKVKTSYEHFRQAYAELYAASYAPAGNLLSPDNWDEMLDWQRFRQVLPLVVMDMKYNQVRPDAVQAKLLVKKGGYYYNNPLKKGNPFKEKSIQMTALLAGEVTQGKSRVQLDTDLFLINTGRKVDHVEFGIGGEEKKYLLRSGESADVDFNKEGNVNVKSRVVLSDGSSFENESSMEVRKSSMMQTQGGLSHQPCNKEIVIADIPFTGYDETEPTLGRVEVNYFYHYDSTDPSGCLVKPLYRPIIVLDGFDPTDKRDATWIYEHNFRYFNQKNEVANFADEQRRAGFDVIIINMPAYQNGQKKITLPGGKQVVVGTLRRAGGDFIEINAMALVKVIENTNLQLAASGSPEKITIVGPSMGGVISRYALSFMEKKGIQHNCGLWFSWDATHLGSVLPIGNQYFIEAMAGLGLRNVKDIINRQINSPASKQELNHHFLANSAEPEGAPEFKDRFYTGIDSMGWPQHTRKIAMISGAINGASQPAGIAGGTAFDFKLKMNDVPRLLLFNVGGIFFNPDFIKAKISFSPSQKQGSGEVMRMKVLGFQVARKTAGAFAMSGNSMDLIQGGWYPGFQEIRDSTRDKLKGFFKWVADPNFLNVVENHCHQPSANTLAFGQGPYPNPARKWDDDLSIVNFNCGEEKEVPWDAWYAPDINLRHDSLTYEYAWRMRDEMNGIHMPQPKVKRQLCISGNTTPLAAGEERKFEIPAANRQTIYNWQLSDNSLQIVAGQGTKEIIVKNSSQVKTAFRVDCSATSNCYVFEIEGLVIKDIAGSSSPAVYSKARD